MERDASLHQMATSSWESEQKLASMFVHEFRARLQPLAMHAVLVEGQLLIRLPEYWPTENTPEAMR